MRHVNWLAAGAVLVAMAGLAVGQGLTREQIEQRVRDAAAVKDDAERLKRFDELAAALATSEGVQTSGGWKIERGTSPVTEQAFVELTLTALEKIDKGDGTFFLPVLTIKVDQGYPICSFHIGTQVSSNHLGGEVGCAIRVDSWKSRQLRLFRLMDEPQRLVLADWSVLLQQIACGERMLMEFETTGGKRAVASFDVSNSREAIKALEETLGHAIIGDCPLSPEEDAAWLSVERIAMASSDMQMAPRARSTVLWMTRSAASMWNQETWEPVSPLDWAQIQGWLTSNPKGRLVVTAFGPLEEDDAPKHDRAGAMRAWFAGQLSEQQIDANRVEVKAASQERVDEKKRVDPNQVLLLIGGFELVFVTRE